MTTTATAAEKDGTSSSSSTTTTIEQNEVISVEQEEEYIERRWNNLLQYCTGNWSGTIGWYDAKVFDNNFITKEDSTSSLDKKQQLVDLIPREDNYQLNFRFQFQTRPNDDHTADWIVYHSSHQGSKEHVVLTKYPSEQSTSTTHKRGATLYVFDNSGIIGRCVREFKTLPFIEHAFWDNSDKTGQRRTVVVTYDPVTMLLNKICFFQLEKTLVSDFDVSGFDLEDCDIMTTRRKANATTEQLYHQTTTLTLEERKKLFESLKIGEYKKHEKVNNQGHKMDVSSAVDDNNYHLEPLNRLFGLGESQEEDKNILRLALPNDVIMACPISLKDNNDDDISSKVIIMGYKRTNGEIQIVELYYSSQTLLLQHVQATWYGEKNE